MIDATYFWVPFLMMAIGFSALIGFTVKNRIDEKYDQLEDMTIEIADSYSHSLAQTSEAYQIITELLDEKIRIAGQAIMLIENRENNEVLDAISQTFNVDEIHLYNNEGEITHSTYEEFIGWKAYEGHPVYEFMMSDQTMLVEDVRPDTENGLYYKFGYVKDDAGGFVQLGVLAESRQDFLEDFEITKLINEISSRGDVKQVFFVNPEYEIIASSLPDYEGRTIENKDLREEMDSNASDVQRAEMDGYEFLRVSVPIFFENDKFGTLLIHWPTEKIDAGVKKIILYAITVCSIIIFTTGGILFYAYRKSKSNIKIAYYDELTGLRNSKYLSEYLDQVLRNPYRRNKAVLLLNFVNFKTLNITYGFLYGDEVLKQIAFKIRTLLDSEDLLFRFDGDRFVVVLDDSADQKELRAFADKLMHIFENPIMEGTEYQYVDIQIAIVEIKDRHTTTDKILQDAILTLSYIKDSSADQLAFFNEDMEKRLLRHDKIVKVLREVIEGKDTESFYLEFQPKLDLMNNKVIGFEALARLRIENLGQIAPDEFIALAEEKLLIYDLGNHILLLACDFLQRLQNEGFHETSVAVNISGIQLLREDFLENLQQKLFLSDKGRKPLEFEVTETVLLDHFSQINESLEAIKKMGIAISLDDFGTGYSSFSRLAELNIDAVKIDRFFIGKISHTSEKDLIISDIISMAHKIGLNVIAEGVEDERQKAYLLKYGCDIIQGYLLSKPLAEESAIAFLRRYEK
ncbi:MAG: GGDEF domain-containing phosphodiesterase [Trichococcus sp.]|uniref:putative bifunctional diguanylate cyclase/phosphodiesterase n=1 Tax=Trichococcus sp. TaxID=1985464 RepID=UPI003C44A6D0